MNTSVQPACERSTTSDPGCSLDRFVRMRIVPTSLEEANAYVTEHHRHHDPVTGHKYSIALADEAGKVRAWQSWEGR